MSGGSILYLADTMFGSRFWFPFFEAMREAEDLCFDAVCFHRYQRDIFAEQPSCRHVFNEPTLVQGYARLPDHYDPALDAWAAEQEERLGCLITDLIQADRHLGLGFQQAGLNNPMTRNRKAASYWRTLRYIRQLDDYVEEILAQSQPTLVVTSVVADLYSKLICAKARQRGISVRLFNSLQVGSLYGWYHDELWNHPPLRQALQRKIEEARARPLLHNAPTGATARSFAEKEPVYATHYLASLKERLTRKALLRSLLREAKVAIGRRRAPRPDRPSFLEAARLQLRIRRHFHELKRRVKKQGEGVPQHFVLYALHKEPEASTMVKAPEMNHQLAIIDLVARSLPSGYKLLIKESMVSLGYRSDFFYRAVSELPNVHLAMPDIRASDLLQQASAAVVITGTVGLEAARMGLPVISFGTRNNYDVFDHVHVVTDFFAVRRILWQELREIPPGVRDARAALGSLYDEAAADVGVEIGEFFEANRGLETPVPAEVISGCVARLRDSLRNDIGALRRTAP